jgi:hypothetical protein
MNAAGDRVAIGAIWASHVRIYQWNGTSWAQMGSDIDEEIFADKSGWSVSINSVGDRVAIGAIWNNGASGTDSGHVRIYEWSGAAWIKIVEDIDGEAANDQSGFSVSMNAAGNRVVIGANLNDGTSGTDRGHVRVYSAQEPRRWVKLGNSIIENNVSDFGASMSMNAAGNRIVIGGTLNASNSGLTSTYEYNGSSWVKLGLTIGGEAANDYSGVSVAMSAVGSIIAIGASGNDNGGSGTSNFGHVRVYSWNGTSWTQVGTDINGEAIGDFSGESIAMNTDGNRVAIGAFLNNGASGLDRGHVRVYSWNGSAWVQLGADIDGLAVEDWNGYTVAMNASGSRIAIGAPQNDASGTDTGQIRVFEYNGSSWVQLGSGINGVGNYASAGYQLAMNAVGNKIVFGYGGLKIFEYNGSSWVQDGSTITSLVGSSRVLDMDYSGNIVVTTSSSRAQVYQKIGASWQLLSQFNERYVSQVATNFAGNIIAVAINGYEVEIYKLV